MRIGITEQGAPSLDYMWFEKVDLVDGVVLVTKNLTDKLIDHLLQCKEKVVLHLSCTGYEGTRVEPNVPTPDIQLP